MNFTNVKSIQIPVNGVDRDVKSISIGGVTVWSKLVTLVSISLSGQTTSLNQGDAFSFGGTVTATYSDGSTADVTASTTFSGYNMSTAGTYTVTASYTENGITATATYQLTVVSTASWHTLWTGSTSVTSSYTGQSYATVYNNDLTGTNQYRITFTMYASGASGTSSQVQYYNNSSSLTSTQPSSPITVTIDYDTANDYIVGIRRTLKTQGNLSPGWHEVRLRYIVRTTGSSPYHRFYLSAYAGGTNYSQLNNSATVTITKIEAYY